MEQSQQNVNEEHEFACQYVTFRAGGLFFGVDVLKVQEIIRFQEMTPVPLSPHAVKGLINLRGQIIAALDLRSILKIENETSAKEPMNVVLRAGDETVSLLVDTIGDVIEVDRKEYEAIPETLSANISTILHGVFKLENELLLVLHPQACVEGRE